MRGATLHDIQFNGTNLTSDLFPNDLLQIFADAGEVLVSEFIGHTRLECSCFRVCNALGNGNDNSLVLCHLLAGIFEELFDGELAFRHIDEVRSNFAVCVEDNGRGSQPAGIPSHDFHDGHRRGTVNRTVPCDFLHGGCHIFCSRAESWGVVGNAEVVVNGLWNANNFGIQALFLDVF